MSHCFHRVPVVSVMQSHCWSCDRESLTQPKAPQSLKEVWRWFALALFWLSKLKTLLKNGPTLRCDFPSELWKHPALSQYRRLLFNHVLLSSEKLSAPRDHVYFTLGHNYGYKTVGNVVTHGHTHTHIHTHTHTHTPQSKDYLLQIWTF